MVLGHFDQYRYKIGIFFIFALASQCPNVTDLGPYTVDNSGSIEGVIYDIDDTHTFSYPW